MTLRANTAFNLSIWTHLGRCFTWGLSFILKVKLVPIAPCVLLITEYPKLGGNRSDLSSQLHTRLTWDQAFFFFFFSFASLLLWLDYRAKGRRHDRRLIRYMFSRVFSHDVTAAILVSQKNETAAMLMSQTSPVGVELLSYANAFFCSNKFAWMLATWVKTLYRKLTLLEINANR